MSNLPTIQDCVIPAIINAVGVSQGISADPNLLGYWTRTPITPSSSVAVDFSVNKNDATLKTGRVVTTDGVDDIIKLPGVGTPVKKIDVLMQRVSGSVLFATDSATQTEDAFASLSSNSNYLVKTLTFTNAIPSGIDLCTDGDSFSNVNVAQVVFYDDSDNIIDIWNALNYENLGAPGLNGLPLITQNGNVGRFVGCSAINAVVSPVPQIAALNYNDYYLPRNSAYYSLDISAGNSTTFFGSCKISCKVAFGQINAFTLFGTNNSYQVGFVSAGGSNFRWQFGSIAGPIRTYDLGRVYEFLVEFNSTGNAIRMLEDGVEIWTGVGSAGALNTLFPIGNGSYGDLEGLLYDFQISESSTNKNCFFPLYGKNATVDALGNLTLKTVNGIPKRALIQESNIAGNDAFGNEIIFLRPTSTTFNVPVGGIIEVSDIAAYDAITNVYCWYYHDGIDKTIVDLGTPSISSVSNVVTLSGITGGTIYTNGQVSSNLQSGWNFIVVTASTSFDCGPIQVEGPQMLDALGLDGGSEFTASQVTALFNKTARAYINFDSNPLNGATFTYNGVLFTYTDGAWVYTP